MVMEAGAGSGNMAQSFSFPSVDQFTSIPHGIVPWCISVCPWTTSSRGLPGGGVEGKAHLSSSGLAPNATSIPPARWAPAVLLISITPTSPTVEGSFLRRRSLTLAPMALPRFLRCWLLPTLSPGPPGSAELRVAELEATGLDK